VLSPRPISESSSNHRLSALSNFYTLLNGKRGYNPSLDVDRFKEPDRKINAIDFSWVKKLLVELPDDNVHSQKFSDAARVTSVMACAPRSPFGRLGSGTRRCQWPAMPASLAAQSFGRTRQVSCS
jgi:hypothetical protein